MSQLGRCTCGTVLVKALGKDVDGKSVDVYVCPKCLQNEPASKLEKKIDKYGMEVLEK